MTTDQDQLAAFVCPRCGGAMYKPANSPFYWHATTDHPRCDITNLANVPATSSTTVPADTSPVSAKQKHT